MPKPFVTVKMTKTSLQLLRQIAAHTDERQYRVLDRLIMQEAQFIQSLQRAGAKRLATYRVVRDDNDS